MTRGAFKESEIGTIATILFKQLKQLHDRGIYLHLVNPQSILVTSGLKSTEDPIKLQITNMIPMIMTIMRNKGNFNFVSGIDRFFLAPELHTGEQGPKSDIWSIGAILYMMVTGGYGNK